MRDNLRRFGSPADLGIRLIILILSAVLLMALQLTGRLGTVEGAVALILAPGQQGLSTLTDRVTQTVSALGNFQYLQGRVTEVESINRSLLAENLRLQEIERENQRLRELLSFSETRPGIELRGGQIIARVIGRDSNNFLNFLMVDLGSRQGIEVGMPVMTNQGLVGRVSEVTSTSSKVLLISDPLSTVNAILQSSRLTGVINGVVGGDPVMGFIPQGSRVGVGEVVLSSGMGRNFPKGIPIGQVTEVRQRDFEVFQEAVVRPIVDFGRLELVLIVTNFDPLEFVPALDDISAGVSQ
ncbi:MAG TPA: rod shape-determining protein MreC [Caldilineaceae bacterium]|nr:rod shape-determining protein MreC [Caldilineaceae bacterium]